MPRGTPAAGRRMGARSRHHRAAVGMTDEDHRRMTVQRRTGHRDVVLDRAHG